MTTSAVTRPWMRRLGCSQVTCAVGSIQPVSSVIIKADLLGDPVYCSWWCVVWPMAGGGWIEAVIWATPSRPRSRNNSDDNSVNILEWRKWLKWALFYHVDAFECDSIAQFPWIVCKPIWWPNKRIRRRLLPLASQRMARVVIRMTFDTDAAFRADAS